MWKPKIGDRVMRRYTKCDSDLDEIGEIVGENTGSYKWLVRWPFDTIAYGQDELVPIFHAEQKITLNEIIKEKDAKIGALQELIDHLTKDGFLGTHHMTDDQIKLLFEAKGWSVSW